MLTSEELWQANTDLVQSCLQSIFIQNLSTGNLSKDLFIQYLRQESFCQEACARAYGVAAAKAPDWEGFSSLHQLMSDMVSSLRVRHQIAAKWGDPPTPLAPHPVIQRYTDFLISSAWTDELGILLSTIVPRFRLSYFLGQSLLSLGLPRHSYADWILNSSSQKSGETVKLLENLLDRYTSLETQQLSNYRYTLICERDFFLAMGQTILNEPKNYRNLPINRSTSDFLI